MRELVDYAAANVDRKDLSIWEVRNHERNFTYSKVCYLNRYMDERILSALDRSCCGLQWIVGSALQASRDTILVTRQY